SSSRCRKKVSSRRSMAAASVASAHRAGIWAPRSGVPPGVPVAAGPRSQSVYSRAHTAMMTPTPTLPPRAGGRILVALVSIAWLAACAPDGPKPGVVTVRLDPAAAGRPISPLIYGVAGADAATLRQLGATLDRWGGNPSSTYNWAG